MFFRYKFHRFIPSSKLTFLGHLADLSRWINRQNVEFSEFPSNEHSYGKRYNLYQFIIETEIKDQDVDYLEFGVSKGVSFEWWMKHLKHVEARFFGFDTFTGLPEDWGPFKKGDMASGVELPSFDDERYTLYQGIFQQTLYPFLKEYKRNGKLVIHLDADLYSSTLFVLSTIAPILKPGDIILFDEFTVPMHEYKAFIEWISAFYIEYKVIGEVNNFFHSAMKLV